LLSCFRLRIASSRPHCLFQYVIYRFSSAASPRP